jgi:hypothetical protein
MITRTQAKEILQILQTLPADKITEVYDYLAFLRERYAANKSIDVSDSWTDADLTDLITASVAHAEKTILAGE